MCTSITFTANNNHYFGRNFDYEFSYHEVVTITPRNYLFNFRKVNDLSSHYAIIGMAIVVENYPLYYDAMNEHGLSMAGLNFPGNTDYKEFVEEKDNVTPFELIPWILGQCRTVKEARSLLEKINLVKINFSDEFPLSPLHWLLADKEESIVIECVKKGLKIYDNSIGVLTNNPPFNYQMFNLNNYVMLSTKNPENHFAKKIDLETYSRGMGGIGIPGDLSSMSRFVKATFTKFNSIVSGDSEEASISQFFHILGSVEQQNGLCDVGNKKYEHTIYSSCYNLENQTLYYKTYNNSQINSVMLGKEDLETDVLISYQLKKDNNINNIN